MSQSRNEFDMISDNPTPLSSPSNLKPPLPVLVKSLNFSYGNNKILTDVDLEIPTGCIQGLLGSNGAGKTTLINLLVGKLKPNSGLISIFGVTTRTDFSNKIGLVAGDEWYGGNLSYHLKSRPLWDNILEDEKTISLEEIEGGFVIIAKPDILSEICIGIFFKVENEGICMVGKKK